MSADVLIVVGEYALVERSGLTHYDFSQGDIIIFVYARLLAAVELSSGGSFSILTDALDGLDLDC
jgi:hypothetical protein